MKESILLIGGGGHCKSCIDVIEQEGRFSIAGIIDLQGRVGEKVFSYPIIASDAELSELAPMHWCLITVGQIKNCTLRLRLHALLQQNKGKFPIVVSPRAYVSPHALIGEGTIVMHGATVNAGARIGSNCIINSHALIEHDAEIGDHCHIATASIINGGVKVGERSFIGSNTVTKEYLVIGSECFIGAGVTVTRNIDAGCRKIGIKP